MTIQSIIESKLASAIATEHLHVVNESQNHNVPAGSESHFKVVLVSEDFADKSLLMRHRLVNKVLEDELANHIHALALHTYTRQEWTEKHGTEPMSPPCLGGSNK